MFWEGYKMSFRCVNNALTTMFVFTCVTQSLFYYFYMIFMSEFHKFSQNMWRDKTKIMSMEEYEYKRGNIDPT